MELLHHTLDCTMVGMTDNYYMQCEYIGYIRTEANTRFALIFTRLYSYSNTRKVFGYTANGFGIVILAYFINTCIFKAILVIQ